MMSSEIQVLQEGLRVSLRAEFYKHVLTRRLSAGLSLLAKTKDFEQQRAHSKQMTSLAVTSLSTAGSEPTALLLVSNEVIRHESKTLLFCLKLCVCRGHTVPSVPKAMRAKSFLFNVKLLFIDGSGISVRSPNVVSELIRCHLSHKRSLVWHPRTLTGL